MRTSTIKTALILFSFTALFSCKSDDDKKPTFKSEDPFDAYLSAAQFTEISQYIDDEDSYEFGMRFIPNVTGQITELVIKLPANQTNLKVTLWDASAKTVVHEETIASVTAEQELSLQINPVNLTKDKEYMITLNTNDYYEYMRTDEGDATYPITAGNISITGYGYAVGNTQTYPDNFQTNYYAGKLSFIFKQTK